MDNLVSIIMPAYNSEKYIAEAIESVIAQTYPNWELIIIDDESKDKTSEIIKSYQYTDSRVKYFWQKNAKQGKARNLGIRNATGTYIAFLDSDDVWVPDKLEHQLKILDSNEVDLVFGYSIRFNESELTSYKIGNGEGRYQGDSAKEFILAHLGFIVSTVLVKKNVIDKTGGFIEDYDIQFCEDWHLWLKIVYSGYSFYTDGGVVCYYRITDGSTCAVEKLARLKFCKAILDVAFQFPKETKLQEITRKDIMKAISNSPVIDKKFVNNSLIFLLKGKRSILKAFLFIYDVNIYLFRKAFHFYFQGSITNK